MKTSHAQWGLPHPSDELYWAKVRADIYCKRALRQLDELSEQVKTDFARFHKKLDPKKKNIKVAWK